jgi:hypothetical protein
MWDRFRKGDRNAFNPRLYTAQGLQTYDEVRRLYGSDRQFRDTVNRYMEEFERLLNTTSRDDRDGAKAKGYLGSDTGMVYTLLAHAAGRLG